MTSVIVVGNGLMGAAAARHLAGAGVAVTLIGPDEPVERAAHDGVFASHYDAGRITRILDSDPVWAQLARASIARYRALEQISGIAFYSEVGHLMVGPADAAPDHFIRRARSVGERLGVDYATLDAGALAERFPHLRFPPGSQGLYQPRDGGYIDPRAMVRAQCEAAGRLGATRVIATVEQLVEKRDGVEVHTDTGRSYRAEQVVLAGGAFSNAKSSLPRPLALTVRARTIALARVGEAAARRLAAMPSLIHEPAAPANHYYLIPPVRYPDGHYYLKLGYDAPDPELPSDDLAALVRWFQGDGDPDAVTVLRTKLETLLPDVTIESWHSDRCATTYTVHGYPYIGRIGDRLAVLTGGNGAAGKSADEIGRLGAAMLMNDGWTPAQAARFAVASQ